MTPEAATILAEAIKGLGLTLIFCTLSIGLAILANGLFRR